MQRGGYDFECLIFSGEKEYLLLPSIPAEIQERILSRLTMTNLEVIRSKEECPDLLISGTSSFKLVWLELNVSMGKIFVFGSFIASELLSNLFENRGFELRNTVVPEWNECQRSVFKETDSVSTMVYVVERNPNISYLGDGTELLHLAVAKKCEPLVQCLLANGADIEARTPYDNTPLHLAIADHPSEIVAKILIEHGADTNATASTDFGVITPLRMCIESRKFDEPARVSMVKLLLENGANLNTHDDSGKSVLVSASLNSPGSLALLLEHQPRLDDSRHGRILQALLTEHCLRTKHCPRSDKEAMKINASIDLLLAYGFEIDRDAAKSKEVFFEAIRLDNIEMVARLLKLGSNPTDEVNGSTALHEAAAMFSSESMIRLLLGFGADINAKTWTGRTALDVAANHGNLGVVKCLLARGAKLVDHPFLLHEAVTAPEALLDAKHQNIVETVKYIIELGADVHAPDHNGELPITLALRHNCEQVMYVLLHHGARLGVLRDFCVAIEEGRSWAVLFYLQNGFDVEKNAEEVQFAIESRYYMNKGQDMMTFFLSFYDPCIFKDVLHRRLSNQKMKTIRLELMKYMNLKTILECEFLEDNISNDAVYNKTIEVVPQNRKAFYQHVFALIHADLTVNNGVNLQESPVVSKLSSLFGKEWSERCKAELSAMKKKTVGSSDVSFHDILDGAPSQILRYLRNEDIAEALEREHYHEDFPIYGGMISQRVRKAVLRKTLLTRGVQMLNFLFKENPELPFPIVERIGNYLSNQELLILSSVFRLPPDIFPPITLDYLGIKKNPDHGSQKRLEASGSTGMWSIVCRSTAKSLQK
ncbi:unnamed protein product [Bemisia tabaci]|uniref:Uncharacterized protein n=1 Tax=Bemisia tabaci TaxID=7038 RepID=A0A9P0AL58_BEMTA|nr:unnamed protein product [Bemisia tabaci]